MGQLAILPQPDAVEIPLPWGPVVRGLCWAAGRDHVLLAHEPGTDLDAWGALPALLASSLDVSAIAIDLPGHGLSDDPWHESRAEETIAFLVQNLVGDSDVLPAPEAESQGEVRRNAYCRFVIAAGATASISLKIAAQSRLTGTVLLSPTADAALRSPRSPQNSVPGDRPKVASLFFAGSGAGDDLQTARRLASSTSGWSLVTSISAPSRGTQLLASPWRTRIEEQIVAFLRDCQHPQSRVPGARPLPPLAT